MHQATPEVISLLEANGWTVECESPFEIRHDESGSFATLLGAHAVVAELLAELEEDMSDPLGSLTQAQAFVELEQVAARVQRLTDVALAAGHEDGDSAHASEAWESAYALVFSAEVSHRAYSLCDLLNCPLSYADPDASYEDDVLAFHRALSDHVRKLKPFFA